MFGDPIGGDDHPRDQVPAVAASSDSRRPLAGTLDALLSSIASRSGDRALGFIPRGHGHDEERHER